MIVFIATAAVKEDKPYGYSLDLASKVRRLFPQTSFYASLSSDEQGQVIFDKLIKERILFDPSLIKEDKKSMVIGEDNSDSAPLCLGAEELYEALEFGSDIKAVVLSSDALYYDSILFSALTALDRLSPSPVLIVDVASASFSHERDSHYEENLQRALKRADIALLEDREKDMAALCSAYVLLEKDRTVFSDKHGSVLKEAMTKAEVLALLMKSECFGSALDAPRFEGFPN